MAIKHSYKNDRISNSSYTDLAGNTVYYAHRNELRLGTYAGFLNSATGHQSYNADGTKTSQPAEDEKISQYVSCEICGLIVTSRKKLTEKDGRFRCSDCLKD